MRWGVRSRPCNSRADALVCMPAPMGGHVPWPWPRTRLSNDRVPHPTASRATRSRLESLFRLMLGQVRTALRGRTGATCTSTLHCSELPDSDRRARAGSLPTGSAASRTSRRQNRAPTGRGAVHDPPDTSHCRVAHRCHGAPGTAPTHTSPVRSSPPVVRGRSRPGVISAPPPGGLRPRPAGRRRWPAAPPSRPPGR